MYVITLSNDRNDPGDIAGHMVYMTLSRAVVTVAQGLARGTPKSTRFIHICQVERGQDKPSQLKIMTEMSIDLQTEATQKGIFDDHAIQASLGGHKGPLNWLTCLMSKVGNQMTGAKDIVISEVKLNYRTEVGADHLWIDLNKKQERPQAQ